MSKRIYITFGGAGYDALIERIVSDGPKFGADQVIVYDDRWLIESGFVNQHKILFETQPQHGFGFCSWKPFVMLNAMRNANPGDAILYTDADTYPIADLTSLFEMCERDGIVLFEEQGCINNRWIKRDCFIAMGCDEPKYHDGQHACGRFQLFRAAHDEDAALLFCLQWLSFSTDPRCSFHDAGEAPNLPTFYRNSTEQAVLSLLAAKHGIPLHRTPDQAGCAPCGQPEDNYAPLFHQEWATGDRTDLSGSKFFNADLSEWLRG